MRLPSIRSKLLAIFLVAGAIPIAVVGLISYFNSLEAVEDMVGNRTGRLVRTLHLELDEKLGERSRDVLFVVNDPVQRFLRESPRQRDQEPLQRYLPTLFRSRTGIYTDLVLADASGNPVFKYHHTQGSMNWSDLGNRFSEFLDPEGRIDVTLEGDLPFSALALLGEEGRRSLMSLLGRGSAEFSEKDLEALGRGDGLKRGEVRVLSDLAESDGAGAFRIVHPVFDNKRPDHRLGTLVLSLESGYLFRRAMAAERFGEFGELAVVDRNKSTVLFHSDPSRENRRLATVDRSLSDLLDTRSRFDESGWRTVPGPEGKRLVVGFSLKAAPWTVVATALPREFETEVQRAGLLNLLVATAAVLLAGVVLLVASGRISRSIHEVTDGARQITAGNLDHEIQVRTHDEIQVLGDTFNEMTRSLSENIALRERAVQELASLNRTLEDRVRERTQRLQSLNEALNEANEELRELDRLKSHFLATVSHELKTPLTSIKAFSEILIDEAGEHQTSRETVRFLGIINSETDRLGRLIRNLLSLSQIESGRMVWQHGRFALVDAIQAALDAMIPILKEKNIRIVPNYECPDAEVEGDADRIHEVITNLLDNAMKFSDREGVIRVSCVREREGEVRVTICDDGVGIPEGDLERVFQRFSQVDPSDTRQKGGTGLGLAICREIVEHHRGRIWAESGRDTGARFHFTLPLVSESVAAGAGDTP